ncbi:MAG: MarR family transcriptional regulator [Clostridiales bacterium]|nr:MarR family transcriptional regulator [Clostridiales bacterium]
MRNLEEIINADELRFEGMDASLFLLGLLSAFENRYQAKADSFFEEISWKQFFAIICINLCKESPTIKELAEIMGSSHQNVKQILIKLENKGFVEIIADEQDKRKQRIVLTEKTMIFCEEHEEGSQRIIKKIFEGIDIENIEIVIKTLLQMEKNLKEAE